MLVIDFLITFTAIAMESFLLFFKLLGTKDSLLYILEALFLWLELLFLGGLILEYLILSNTIKTN
jgi:hypothetical protein